MLPRILFAAIVLTLIAGGGYGVSRMIVSRQPLPRATALLEQADPRGAQLLLRPLVRAEPRNAEAHVLLARTQLELNDPVAAEKELKIARALRYERIVLHPLLGRAYLMQDRPQDVLADIPGTAVRDEEQASNLAVRALAYLAMNDVRLAEVSLESAVRLAPEDPTVLLGQARVLLARGQFGAAAEQAGRVLAQVPRSLDAMMVKAEAQSRRGDPEAALATMSQAIAQAPFSVPARLQRANQLMALSRFKLAQQDIDASFEVDWHDSAVVMTNAVLMMRTGRLKDAETEFQRLQPLMERIPRGYFYQALTAFYLDQNESALETLGRFLKLQPNDADGLRLAGILEAKLGRPERAIDLLSRAVRAGTSDAEAFNTLGRSYFRVGRIPEAVENYRRASSIDPANAEFAAHLTAALSLAAGGAPGQAPAPR